jgi:hypothetical protein
MATGACRLLPEDINPETIEEGPQRKSAGLLLCTSALDGLSAVVRRFEPEQSLSDKNFVERNRHLRRCRALAAADIELESMRGQLSTWASQLPPAMEAPACGQLFSKA